VASPILALAIAMVQAPFWTLLVAAVGQAVLLPTRLLPTEVAAVVLSPVTVATDPEDQTAVASTANSLPEDNFAVGRHPRPKVGLDIGDRSWQLEHLLMFGCLMKVCHTGNSTALTVGFPFPPPAVIKLSEMSEDEGCAPAAQMLICFIFPASVQKNTDSDDR
jgi:hypothetical protein